MNIDNLMMDLSMPKTKTKSKKTSGNKGDSRKGRPKPSSPRAGFRVDGRRYDNGGKVSR